MADILIRGMEMPKSCEDCPLVQENENVYGDTMSRECNLIYKGYTSEAPKGRRRADCPLVPLPEGHGRLGDLDAPIRVVYHDGTIHETTPSRLLLKHSLLDLPKTIVPAEGGTDNG